MFSLVLSAPFFSHGYFFGHEGVFPFYRIVGIDMGFRSGQFPVKILPNLVNGFGYGWNIFYPPLSYETTWAIYRLGFGLLASVKIVHFLSLFLSAVFMFIFARRYFKSANLAFLSAVFYLYAPYRSVDIFCRNDYAEAFAFIFLPIVFHGVYELVWGDSRKIGWLAVGLSGMVLSHIISAFYALFFMALFIVMNGKKILAEPRRSRDLLLAGLAAFGLSAYFAVPFLEHSLLGHYAIYEIKTKMGFDPQALKDSATLISQFWGQRFPQGDTLGNEMPFLGAHASALLFLSLAASSRLMKRPAGLCFLALGMLSVFMELRFFPWRWLPSSFFIIQFPWRLFMFSTFFLSLTAPLAVEAVPARLRTATVLGLVGGAVVFGGICSYKFFSPLYRPDMESSFPDFSLELNKQPPFIGTSVGEYLPYAAFQNRKYIGGRSDEAIVLDGNADIRAPRKTGATFSFDAVLHSTRALVELPLIYYLGYDGRSADSSGKWVPFKVVESDHGFCAVEVAHSGSFRVEYRGTLLSRLSFYISIVALFAVLFGPFLAFWGKSKTLRSGNNP